MRFRKYWEFCRKQTIAAAMVFVLLLSNMPYAAETAGLAEAAAVEEATGAEEVSDSTGTGFFIDTEAEAEIEISAEIKPEEEIETGTEFKPEEEIEVPPEAEQDDKSSFPDGTKENPEALTEEKTEAETFSDDDKETASELVLNNDMESGENSTEADLGEEKQDTSKVSDTDRQAKPEEHKDTADHTEPNDKEETGIFIEQEEYEGSPKDEGNGALDAAAVDEDTQDNLTSQELFETYFERKLQETLSPDLDMDLMWTRRGDQLEGNDKKVYDFVMERIKAAADGELDSSSFELPISDLLEQTSYTAEELGVESIVRDGAIASDAEDAIWDMASYHARTVFKTILADAPYELYWYDNEYGMMSGARGSIGSDGENLFFCDDAAIIVRFYVSYRFSQGEYKKTTDIDRTRTGAALAALQKAQSVVAACSSETDYRKLQNYMQTICDLTEYNNEAALKPNYPDSGAWQLIYVFDEDPETKVVCEGYAKAFKYLCDLTDFRHEEIECSMMTGAMNGGYGEELHMWNLVHMENGLNYHVDITNSDAGTIGEMDPMFLKGKSSVLINGYGISSPSYSTLYYRYDADTLRMFSAAELEIADADYEPSEEDPVIPPESTLPFRDVAPEAWYYPYVEYAYTSGLMNGVSAERFAPDQPLTRAMGVQVLYNYSGQPEAGMPDFYDVQETDWFAKAVGWAGAEGIVGGYPGNIFKPDTNLSREQLLLVLNNYSERNGKDVSAAQELSTFTDAAEVDDWALTAVKWGIAERIIGGKPDGSGGLKIDPLGAATRAEFATIMRNYIEEYAG